MESNVISTSMVGLGAVFFELPDGRVKAFERRAEILSVAQSVVMLSGKSGESITKTSSSFRRPRRRPLFTSSVLRVAPRPSASPGVS